MAACTANLTRTLSHLRASTLSLSTRTVSRTIPQTLQSHRRYASNFDSMPSPFRLPPEEQAEFERLQRTANTQEGFNPTSSPDFSTPTTTTTTSTKTSTTSTSSPNPSAASASSTDPEAPTPLRKGAPPEFEGEVNPRTGEVGGPKNEPLRWGAGGDYSYNGRVTDF
ncbi:hypothetical protein F5B22DRAFT_608383 [Xylaria bambusicola]|uniref:uncharacterized protein n=1 Tax=Xylaria bambusicola TaxID=326684 RepID=UPI00200746BC|nr:uncharacterized protein F5B22DRAFT_608383 [Xylaria bambusicola]KAI0515119.1 hypothetical protein F5B22DRAFT_608383 [Xylaria bambusicola]